MKKMKFAALLTVAALTVAAVATAPQMAMAQDAGAGKTLFGDKCGGCHSVDNGGASGGGPNLFGVSGAVAANRGVDFDYSDALIDSGIIWDDGNLDAWIESWSDLVPGTNKPNPGVAAGSDRANLVAYLKTLK